MKTTIVTIYLDANAASAQAATLTTNGRTAFAISVPVGNTLDASGNAGVGTAVGTLNGNALFLVISFAP